MNNFLEKLKDKIELNRNKVIGFSSLLFLAVVFLVSLFDKNLAVGLVFALILTLILFLLIFKILINDKKLILLLLIVFIIHLFLVIFIYYTGFRPSGGGADFEQYNQNAIEVAQRLKAGNFSLEGTYRTHYFAVLIGIIYTFTTPDMIVGQIFSAWLATLSVLLAYFLIIEIGGSKKSAFIAGLLISFYPSYMYFGSLLLKDTIVLPLALAGLLLAVQIMKRFDGFFYCFFFYA
mgnify:CR=1 FL=1